MVKCLICNKNFKNLRCLSLHLKCHNILSKEYYDIYIKKEKESMCKSCQKPTRFINIVNGYKKYCSIKCALNSHEIREKIKQTNLKIFGVENPSQNKDIKNKKVKTCILNYGVDNPNKSDIVKNKKIKTCILNYGVDNPNKSDIVKNKTKNKNLNKCFNNILIICQNLKIKFVDEKYLGSKIIHNWKCLKCNCKFQQMWNKIQQGYNCPKCYPRNQGYSKGEKELLEFIKSLDLEIIENSREIIKPYELDIYLPSKNVAIEFNGLYWHSENQGKDKFYHLNKTEECEKNNIKLIHIFEDEWIFKKEIVESRLIQILGINKSERIHARKCKIKEINPKIKNEFLNLFHIQGEDRSVVKLGAFYNDELVSVMTFSKGNISKGSKNIYGVWELNRFCSNSYYRIPGIASKILMYFKRNYEWNEIFSYADRRWSDGNVYFHMGFKLDYKTKPNYWYIKNGVRIYRFNLRKRPDEPKDIPEWVLRAKEGYHRIWDCGHLKFVYRRL